MQKYRYETFGLPTPTDPSFRQSYAFTAREWDRETGLYFYRARYYDPMEGRFISKDPIGFAGGDVNFYGYVLNNPNNFVDPTGENAVLIRGGQLLDAFGKSALVSGLLTTIGSGMKENWNPAKTIDDIPDNTFGEPLENTVDDECDEDDGLYESCMRLYILCDKQQWRGDCDSCFQFCKAQGYWDYLNCPPGSCRWT